MNTEQAAQEFLHWVTTHRKPNTHKRYREHLDHLVPYLSGLNTNELRAYHLRDFISSQSWGRSYKTGSIVAAKRWGSWLVERELLSQNPFSGVTMSVLRMWDGSHE